ncbi:MotA/TolQ/ExbB proton channel family protein [Betaproteobacteria bacterium]|nr:MotA/TolQ/ExbB proton channel family protein [Betaproteobacteria bacterium]
MKIQKLMGLLIVIAIIFGATLIVGFQLFLDVNSILFVLGGATGYTLLKSNRNNWVKNIGNGAIYFGWLGTLIGLIAIAGNRLDVWSDMDKLSPALAVAMLTIFYGYLLKLITMAFEK